MLQKDLDLINGTAMKLETQKAEAQKKLDELDDRVGDIIGAFDCVYSNVFPPADLQQCRLL